MEFKKDQEMQDRNKHPQGPDESSLDSVPPSTMDSSLLDSPLYDEENAGNSDRDSSEEEEDAQQNPGYPSRQKETRVLPDSEEQARSRAASLANLQVTLQEERRGLL